MIKNKGNQTHKKGNITITSLSFIITFFKPKFKVSLGTRLSSLLREATSSHFGVALYVSHPEKCENPF